MRREVKLTVNKLKLNLLIMCILIFGTLSFFLIYSNYSLNLDSLTGAVSFSVEVDDTSQDISTADSGYNIGIFQTESGNFSSTWTDNNIYFSLRRQSGHAGAANQSLAFDIRKISTNSSLKITKISGTVKYCHAREPTHTCDGSGDNKNPQGNAAQMNILIEDRTGNFVDIGDITPTTTNTERLETWNLDSSQNLSNFVNTNGFINMRFEFAWDGSGKSAFLNDQVNLTIGYDTKPDVILSSPADNSEFLGMQNINLECNSTDDSGLANITLYLIKNEITSSYTTVNLAGTQALTVFTLSDLSKGNYTWNCLVSDAINDAQFYNNNFTFRILNNLSATSLGCNSTFSTNYERSFITGHATLEIDNSNWISKIKNFFKGLMSFTGLVILEDTDTINCYVNITEYEGQIDISANLSLPDGYVVQQSVTNINSEYATAITNLSLMGVYSISWKIADSKKTLFVLDGFILNTTLNNSTNNSTSLNNPTNNSSIIEAGGGSNTVSNIGDGGSGRGGNKEEDRNTKSTAISPQATKPNIQPESTPQTQENIIASENENKEEKPITNEKTSAGFTKFLGNTIKRFSDLNIIGMPVKNIKLTLDLFNKYKLLSLLLFVSISILSLFYIIHRRHRIKNREITIKNIKLANDYYKDDFNFVELKKR